MIIGFIGQKGSGKTTAVNYLKDYFLEIGQPAINIDFKHALIDEIKIYLPTVLEVLAEQEKMTVDELFDKKPPLMRALMQNFGTELRRTKYTKYWLKKWREAITRPLYNDIHILVGDVRFNNEAQMIKANKGILIRLTRIDLTNEDQHESEQQQLAIKCDYEITSDAGQEEYVKGQIKKNVEELI